MASLITFFSSSFSPNAAVNLSSKSEITQANMSACACFKLPSGARPSGEAQISEEFYFYSIVQELFLRMLYLFHEKNLRIPLCSTFYLDIPRTEITVGNPTWLKQTKS